MSRQPTSFSPTTRDLIARLDLVIEGRDNPRPGDSGDPLQRENALMAQHVRSALRSGGDAATPDAEPLFNEGILKMAFVELTRMG